jgi:hypothetical protein
MGWDLPLEYKLIGDIYELDTLGMTLFFLYIGVKQHEDNATMYG